MAAARKTQKNKNPLERALSSHESIRAAADALGLPKSTFFDRIMRKDARTERGRPRRIPGSAADRKKAVTAALKQYGSIRAAAENLGVPKSTLFDIARELGLSTPTTKKKVVKAAKARAAKPRR
jgi:IS30 family transposase